MTKNDPKKTSERYETLISVLRACKYLAIVATILIVVLFALFSVLFKLGADAGGYSEKWNDGVDGTLLTDVAYGERDWEIMSVYLPKKPAPERSHGAILFIHGGGWSEGSRVEQQGFARRMAKDGWLTANMEYMLYNDRLSAEDREAYDVYKVLDEIDRAIAKLVEVGKEHGYSLDRVALSGHSAGGHLSLLYGYTYRTRENANPPVDVAFIAPRVGPSDFYTKDAWGPETGDLSGSAYIVSMLAGEKFDSEELRARGPAVTTAVERISPAFFLAENPVPTLAAYGGKDSIVPKTQYEALEREFHKVGAVSLSETPEDGTKPAFDLILFPHSDHMLSEDRATTARWFKLFNAYARRYLTERPAVSEK